MGHICHIKGQISWSKFAETRVTMKSLLGDPCPKSKEIAIFSNTYDFFQIPYAQQVISCKYTVEWKKKFGHHSTVPIQACAHTIVSSRLSPETFVPRPICSQAYLCPDTFVLRNVCAHPRLCPITFVPTCLCLNMIVHIHDCAHIHNNNIIIFMYYKIIKDYIIYYIIFIYYI